MNKDEIQAHRALLQRQLWAVADELRGVIGPDSYKDYMLGTLFYKYLSEITETHVEKFLEVDNITYVDAWNDPEYREALIGSLKDEIHFVIPPNHLYSTLIKEIEKGIEGQWSVDLLAQAFRDVETSATTAEGAPNLKFQGLFEDVNLTHSGLGRDIETRSRKMGTVLTLLNRIDFKLNETELDVLGDAYEYLIGEFAASAGKKGGEFYTPQSVSKLIATILGYERPDFTTAYDPTCGSGSMLLRVAKETKTRKADVKLYGQELNQTTYNAARMNMFIHNVPVNNFFIENGDTLEEDMHTGIKVDVVSANPPYSAKWKHTDALEQDPRYAPYGKLAPKDKADYAFVLNILHHLNDNGVAAVVLPHGVLFRGGAEGAIRKKLVDDNLLHAVIGLPANLFYGTSIPTAILVFKKNRKPDEKTLFIDASNDFGKGKNQNHLETEHLDAIFKAYKERVTVDKYAELVNLDKIKENDYNLNIPRYVDTTIEEELVDLGAISAQLWELGEKETQLQAEIDNWINQLEVYPTPDRSGK